jgi:hypothetical protein
MKLTTITPYWNRPEMLKGWVHAMRGASLTEVDHIIYFIGTPPPDWWASETTGLPLQSIYQSESPGLSIGHYHNLGAARSQSEWIMKLDIDVIPNVNYFASLLPLLACAPERAWYCGGMLMLSRNTSARLKLPLSMSDYQRIISVPRLYTSATGWLPQGTNFICRREEYLKLGGCDERFRGYGWEDYQQIYMLERHQLGGSGLPLPGLVDLDNVTRRCRDEISRKKAFELYAKDSNLCLFHRFHPPGVGNRGQMDRNRELLYSYIRGVS